MTDPCPKRVVLSALSHAPDFSGIQILPRLNSNASHIFQCWLDRSGLALGFFRQLQNHNIAIPKDWHQALEQRWLKNTERMQGMLAEAQHLHNTFRSFAVTAVCLKGFTLTPDFCDDPFVRHQVDFDFLVAPSSVHAAAEALRFCGYSAARLNEEGETCFRTASQHIPSANDDLYVPQAQRQVDLHTSIWEPCAWLRVEVPQDCLKYARPHSNHGMECLSLSLEDKFLVQVLHAFRHALHPWLRVSWLLEIGKCLDKHQENTTLWNRVIHRAGSTHLAKSIFGFVLGLVHRLFHTPIPAPLGLWTENAITVSLRVWLDHFGVDWALCDWPGSLNNLFFACDFIPDPDLRKQYVRSRLLPGKAPLSLGSRPKAGAPKFLQWQAARLRYVAQRAAAHLKDLLALPWQSFRWRRALESSRRLTFDATG